MGVSVSEPAFLDRNLGLGECMHGSRFLFSWVSPATL